MFKEFRFFCCFVFFGSIYLYGDGTKNNSETMQINGDLIEQNGTIITAKGNILAFSPTYYITADKAIYDTNKTTMELFGKVNISKNKEHIALSNYTFLDMKNEIDYASPVLLFEKKSDIWITAQTIDKKEDLNLINNAMISSCDCENPTWSIGFKNGDYNTTDQWINIYNNTLYIKEIPAWYFLIPAIPYASVPSLIGAYLIVKAPYLGFSTDTKRRTGLLRPQIGYGADDGFLYAQPIYFAPREDVDFEYIPQIRLQRGSGHEFKARYVDSLYSRIDFESGIFTEKEDYFTEKELINKQHFGWNLKYNRTKVLSNQNHVDGLYIYLQDMNDVEFLNTKYNSKNDISIPDKILESKIKYFYNTPQYNMNGEIVNYNNIDYIGTEENNDDKVMQITPYLNFHQHTDSLFINKITNSLDLKYKRAHRIVGLGGETFEATLPIGFSYPLFKDYLLFSYEKSFHFNYIQYLNNSDATFDNGSFLESKDIFSLETDLIKNYDNTTHTLNLFAKYTKPKYLQKEGDLYGITSNDSDLAIFPYGSEEENIKLSFAQALYNRETLNPYFSHKINQIFLLNKEATNNLGDLENELVLYLPHTKLSNRLFFNHNEKLIVSSVSSLDIKKDTFFAQADYSFSRDKTNAPADFLYKNLPTVESVSGEIGNKVFKYYTLGYKEQYDLTHHISKMKEYKLMIDKKCWSLGLSFQDSLVATATISQAAKRQNIIYATITLKPIFSFNQKIIQSEREE